MWFRGLLPSLLASDRANSPAATERSADATLEADFLDAGSDPTQRSAGVEAPPTSTLYDVDNLTITAEPEVEHDGRDFPQPGAVIGGTYQVISEIGRGAMGVVLSAFDQKLERPVAIKLIRAELLEPGFRQRFMQEARVMAQINHPNVVCIHAFGEHRGMPYFVMELVEGTNLEQWMQRADARSDLRMALQILKDVCLGVSAIHSAGAVHRDLKPSNILLDTQLRSRVADFGVSTRNASGGGHEVVGTPGYMPPEALLSPEAARSPLPQSDVYSLGCIAYELLTGKHPFRRKGERLVDTARRTSLTELPAPSSVRPDLPAAFDRVLLQALQQDPGQRTPSVDAFRQALVDASEHDGIPDRILVAEDDEDFRDLVEFRLRKEFPESDVECVNNGRAALEALDRKPASIALIDLQMPGMDGVTLTALLRTRASLSSMPIIVLTASGGAREWQRLSTMGADRFLVKPCQLDDIVTFIRQALRERRAKEAESSKQHVHA
jgi:eukaryotic-like serine/threonine-protein kinase